MNTPEITDYQHLMHVADILVNFTHNLCESTKGGQRGKKIACEIINGTIERAVHAGRAKERLSQ